MMDKEKAMKVAELMSGDGNFTEADYQFLSNNLAPFSDVLISCGVEMMTQAGIEQEEALALLENLAMVSRMAGASNFKDFVELQRMEG
jgi:hypothetical protein